MRLVLATSNENSNASKVKPLNGHSSQKAAWNYTWEIKRFKLMQVLSLIVHYTHFFLHSSVLWDVFSQAWPSVHYEI